MNTIHKIMTQEFLHHLMRERPDDVITHNSTRSPAVARMGPTVLVVTDIKGQPSSVIFISSERAYATSYR